MNRRQILQYTAWITGAAVSAPLAGAILSGCSRSSDDDLATPTIDEGEVLHFFSPEQFMLVHMLADTILPRTDSPSATDVGVHHTLDSMLGRVFDPDFASRFKANWRQLEIHLDEQGFVQLAPTERAQILSALELSGDPDHGQARSGLVEFKQQVIAYYLSTETVAKNHLNYVPIPGTYQPCISVDDVNNTAWAI